jgi:hypothetical protein
MDYDLKRLVTCEAGETLTSDELQWESMHGGLGWRDGVCLALWSLLK